MLPRYAPILDPEVGALNTAHQDVFLQLPNLESAILHRQVLTPLDLEETYGLPEGNINHGEHTLDQLLFMRPVPGVARYRTPIDGLFLCGAGTHPGGGVTGYPGYNAAREILRAPKD